MAIACFRRITNVEQLQLEYAHTHTHSQLIPYRSFTATPQSINHLSMETIRCV